MSASDPAHTQRPVRGVVAVIVQRGKLLVIRRSQQVRAPFMYCFPGGRIEAGEDEPQAMQRELQEELGVAGTLKCRLWSSTTSWGVELAWWHVEIEPGCHLAPNPAEIESLAWCTTAEMRALAGLLSSNLDFLDALAARVFEVPGLDDLSPAAIARSDSDD